MTEAYGHGPRDLCSERVGLACDVLTALVERIYGTGRGCVQRVSEAPAPGVTPCRATAP